MNNISQFIQKGVEVLKNRSVDNASYNVEFFLSSLFKVKRSDLYLLCNKKLSNYQKRKFNQFIKRKSKNEPVEAIAGNIDFYNTKIFLNKNVLIPRVETEILVDHVVNLLKNEELEGKILFDICTGTGAIAIALKKVFPKLTVYAFDISKKALYIAKKNAKKNGVEIFFKESDILKNFERYKADFIIANPPYISSNDYLNLNSSVKDFEPKIALTDGSDGLIFYRRFENELKNYLNPGAKLFFEIGYNQKKDILKIFSDPIWIKKKVLKDFSDKNRFFFVEIE
ncbi:MAG: protein-(glutamine-N5) methyltransferase, release factor-specific [Chlamydiae bacterium RIFCSPHIGHO2_12_FULL_27_8]|nr:MAG: protein-(glutamine-N5) methyltransferase, release factor-specific [Chlamydiae bacterium RIFCSPHIGHO2_12_FULL_27_8]